ncbi:MAG: hypothetical protein IFK93_10925 [Acidobacteria bacterium]|nr:hypothetical protein [Candidatus Sulfomarinibacter kjeldsenii]
MRVEEEFVAGSRRAVEALGLAVDELAAIVPEKAMIEGAIQRGYFRPDEEAVLLAWLGRFLTIRNGLWEVLGDVSRPVGGSVRRVLDLAGWRCFVLGYTSACLIVRLDLMLLEEVARDSVTQRKLNEGSEMHRIPRKQFTAVFESFTDPVKARSMEQAMRFARRHRNHLETMADDPVVGRLVADLKRREEVLEPSRRRYLSRLVAFLGHAIRRTGASARQQALFSTLETGGRLASELRDHWTPDRIGEDSRRDLEKLMQPGDVLVTRHDHAFTNLFLPGYWPHAALYVGSETDRRQMQIDLDPEREARWCGDRRVLEALKDGVLFRPLEETLAVDAVAVIRPQLGEAELGQAIARAAQHEGKLYDFDFDFFRSDRLVCTEVMYRAFDGLGPVKLTLTERSGRPTLSAEDLLDLAVDGRGFDPVAVCGAPTCPETLIEGESARDAILRSYR